MGLKDQSSKVTSFILDALLSVRIHGQKLLASALCYTVAYFDISV